jgi:trans-aconitate 2-methyltransferase
MEHAATWDPGQYQRFAAERAQPFHDLVDLVEGPVDRLVDLGCGTGELTAHAARGLGATRAVGVDNAPKMLDAARPHASDVVRFEHGDIATWTSTGDIDLVLANASLQWVPHHATVLARWTAALALGGQLAVQVPANAHRPTHTVAARLAEREPYASAFGTSGPPIDPVATNVLRPDDYAELLHALGFERQHVRLHVYPHELPSTAHAVEWVKGTTLTRFEATLPPELYERFLVDYERELTEQLGDRRPLFFPFSRTLMWGRLPR